MFTIVCTVYDVNNPSRILGRYTYRDHSLDYAMGLARTWTAMGPARSAVITKA